MNFNSNTYANTISDQKSRLTSYGSNIQNASYETNRNTTALISSTTSSQRGDGLSYSGQYEGQVGNSTAYQTQSSSYLPTNSGYQASSSYQTNLTSNLGTGTIQGSTFQSSYKSGSGYTLQSGSTTQQGSSFTSNYQYKKPWSLLMIIHLFIFIKIFIDF